MIKYKLIKEYPGCPELGTIVIETAPYIFRHELAKDETYTNCHVWPEYWEKIVEKDYEILSFIANKKHGKKGYIVDIKNGKSIIGNNSVQDYIDDVDDWWEIHTIKRLSDGEIFTIGDKITGTYSVDEHNDHRLGYTILKEFYITNDKIGAAITTGYCTPGSAWLNKISKYKEPLFKTEDGIDIYKNDRYYYWDTDDVDCLEPYIDIADDEINRRLYLIYKTFSTKEKAEQYIKANKPKTLLFTTEDGVNIYEDDSYYCVNTNRWTSWLQIAKEKTKLNKSVLAFSLKENAQELVSYNVPYLSLNDVRSIIKKAIDEDYLFDKEYRKTHLYEYFKPNKNDK